MSNESDTSQPSEAHGGRESGLPVLAGIVGAILGVVAVMIATVALISSGDGPAGEAPEEVAAPIIAKTFEVELGDFFIRPDSFAVEPDTEVTFMVTNKGGIAHVLAVAGSQLNADQADYLELLATLVEGYDADHVGKLPAIHFGPRLARRLLDRCRHH